MTTCFELGYELIVDRVNSTSALSFAAAAPESMDVVASGMACEK